MNQSAATPTSRPAYRPPWTDGAKAYQEADTWEALRDGMKRKRRLQFVSIPTALLAGTLCPACHHDLASPYPLNPGDDPTTIPGDRTTIKFHPKTKSYSAAHYYCSWGQLITDILDLGDRLK